MWGTPRKEEGLLKHSNDALEKMRHLGVEIDQQAQTHKEARQERRQAKQAAAAAAQQQQQHQQHVVTVRPLPRALFFVSR